MKTRLSLLSRGMTRRTRVLVIALAALLPLTVLAQQGAQAPQSTVRRNDVGHPGVARGLVG